MSQEKDPSNEIEQIWKNKLSELSQFSEKEFEAAATRARQRRNAVCGWVIGAFISPIFVSITSKTSYTFAFSVAGIGLFLYIFSHFVTIFMIERKMPGATKLPGWQDNVPAGLEGGLLVPRWVSVLGMIGIAACPSGLIVALLLWMGMVD